MGEDRLIALRYAKAFQMSLTESMRFEGLQTLENVAVLFKDPQAAKFLKDPTAKKDQILSLLIIVLKREGTNSASKLVASFLQVLVEARRVGLLPQIVICFKELLLSKDGEALGVLTSARQLSDEERSSLDSLIQEKLGKKKIHLSYEVDPLLLGGFSVRVGQFVLDLSVRSRMNVLMKSISI